jgi:Uma2 family endonuclease
MPARSAYLETDPAPRLALVYPLELPPPDGFEPARPETWPQVHGRLELVEGRLLYMPPCGGEQNATAAAVVGELWRWRGERSGFTVGGNEAGMMFGREVRAADAAVWRSGDLGPVGPGYPRVPPVLAVEVVGRDEDVEDLSVKARWYLDRGVEVVWILVPATHGARVVTAGGTVDVAAGGRMPAHPSLPGLEPRLVDLFAQLGPR